MAAERMRPWGRCKNINWLTFASRRQFDFWFLPKLVIGRFDQLAQALQQSSSKTVSTSEIFSVLDNPELLIWYYIENQFWPADCTLTWGGWLEWWTSSVFIRFWFLRYFAHLIREPVSLAKRSDWAEFPANLIFLRRTRQVFNISLIFWGGLDTGQPLIAVEVWLISNPGKLATVPTRPTSLDLIRLI